MTSAIACISSMATRLILSELAQRYQAKFEVQAVIRSIGGVEAARLVRAGEHFDIVVLAANAMAELEAQGHIVRGTTVGIARSVMAVAIPAGADRPDIGSEAAVRRAVCAAGRIGYSTGPSGDHLLRLTQRWGVKPEQLIKAPPGVPVGALVARGEAELGFQQLSELVHVPGVEVVGPLPDDIQCVTVFSAGVCERSSQPSQASGFIDFLCAPENNEVAIAQGMTPAREPT